MQGYLPASKGHSVVTGRSAGVPTILDHPVDHEGFWQVNAFVSVMIGAVQCGNASFRKHSEKKGNKKSEIHWRLWSRVSLSAGFSS